MPRFGNDKTNPLNSLEVNQCALEQGGAPKPPGIQAKALSSPSCYSNIWPFSPKFVLLNHGAVRLPDVGLKIHGTAGT